MTTHRTGHTARELLKIQAHQVPSPARQPTHRCCTPPSTVLLCSSPCSAECSMIRNMWCLRRDVPTSKLLVGLDRQHTSPNGEVAAQSRVVQASSESVCPRNEPQCLASHWSTTARDLTNEAPCLSSRYRPCSFPRKWRANGPMFAWGVSSCRVACTTIRCAHHYNNMLGFYSCPSPNLEEMLQGSLAQDLVAVSTALGLQFPLTVHSPLHSGWALG